MKAKIISLNEDEKTIECKDLTFEGGFIVFEGIEEDKDLLISPAKIAMMEVTGRPKKPKKK